MTVSGDTPPAPPAQGDIPPPPAQGDTPPPPPAQGDTPPIERTSRRRNVVRGVLAVTALLGLLYLLRTFWIEPVKIPSPDMAPTLLLRDHIFARKSAYGWREHRLPTRGDVVVYRQPEHPEQDFVHRVIGLPGDTITVQEAAVFINGWRIPTCVVGAAEVTVKGEKRTGIAVVELLGDTAYLVFHDEAVLHARAHAHEPGDESEGHHAPDSEGPYTVANNEVFVLGDNRENSDDSRGWFEGRGGGVRVDQIKGRASTIWSSIDEAGHIPWSRVGRDVTGPPKCPDGFPPATCTALEQCLANRPPRSATTPPEWSLGAPKPP